MEYCKHARYNSLVYWGEGIICGALIVRYTESGKVTGIAEGRHLPHMLEAERKKWTHRVNKKGHSAPGLFGQINHYDQNGCKTGESRPNIFGGFTEYDSNGKKVSESQPGYFVCLNHYDQNRHKTEVTGKAKDNYPSIIYLTCIHIPCKINAFRIED